MQMSRRHAIAALGSTMLMPIVAGPAFGAVQSDADKAFAKLAQNWLDQSMKFSPVSATQVGDHRFDSELDDVSAVGRNAGLAFYKQTLKALDAIDRKKLSRANQVDAALLSNELRSQIWRTERVSGPAMLTTKGGEAAWASDWSVMALASPCQMTLTALMVRSIGSPARIWRARSTRTP